MTYYILKRIAITIPMLFAMSLITFLFVQAAPGDVLAKYRANPQYQKETIDKMEQEFHFDKPAMVQYYYWMKNLLRFEQTDSFPYIAYRPYMGYSFLMNEEVSTVIKSRLFYTLLLAFFSILITWLIAIPLGIYAAVNQYKWSDRFFSFISYIGISFPNFFLALVIMFLSGLLFQWILTTFGVEIGIFKALSTGGLGSSNYDTLSTLGKLADRLMHMLLPAIVLGTAAMASLQRIMRGNMLEELRQRYVTTARSKGLSEHKVIYKHALRNAINPLITIFGYELSALLSGAALTEIVTGWPGLGSIMLEAVRGQDLFLVMGNMLMGGVMLIVGNLVADILLAVTDPRIKLS